MFIALLSSIPACAAVFNVSSGDVTGLIAAINAANANGQENTINLEPGTYSLTTINNNTDGPNGLPSVTSTLTIQGVGGAEITIVQRDAGAPEFRLMHVAATGTLTLDALTLQGGNRRGLPDDFVTTTSGGGIFSSGTLTAVTNSILSGNTTSDCCAGQAFGAGRPCGNLP